MYQAVSLVQHNTLKWEKEIAFDHSDRLEGPALLPRITSPRRTMRLEASSFLPPKSRFMRKNITVSINDQVYRDARVWCVRRNTSISAVVQRFLEDLPHIKACRQFPLPDAPHAPVFKNFINSPGPAAAQTPPPAPEGISCDSVTAPLSSANEQPPATPPYSFRGPVHQSPWELPLTRLHENRLPRQCAQKL